VPRLRRADCAGRGFTRRRRGRGFDYYDDQGNRITDPIILTRIEELVIPPAWGDVWICPWPNGHIQATGTDAAGRRQYRYHDEWRTQRDAAKHLRVLDFARRLPRMRQRVELDLVGTELSERRVLATAVRLLDLGFFRVGSEEYAEENQTYGLATLRKDHVSIQGDVLVFDYEAKGGKQRVQSVVDPAVLDVVRTLKRRRGGGAELLAYRSGGRWRDVRSDAVNAYIREVTGGDFTAKDFRTWHATVLMAVALAVSIAAPTSTSGRKRAVSRAVTEVASYLGNTPAVARASYIDPRVIDLYEDGVTIAPALERLGADVEYGSLATHGVIERSVLRMLNKPQRASRGRGGDRSLTAARTRRSRATEAA
jgi:DNA topoisomerase I